MDDKKPDIDQREEFFFEKETRKHQQEVAKIMIMFAQELLRRAMVHDASKLEDPEREGFKKATPGLRDLTYGSAEYSEVLKEMGPTLRHHYAHNDHHPEYFDTDPSCNGVDEMSCSRLWR